MSKATLVPEHFFCHVVVMRGKNSGWKKVPSVIDPMGETCTREELESLAYNIDRDMRNRPLESQPLLVAELGTWSGQFTLAIAQPHVLVHCISSWERPNEFLEAEKREK